MSSDSDSSGLPLRGRLRRTAARRFLVARAGVGAVQAGRRASHRCRVGSGGADRRGFGAPRGGHAEVRRRQAGCAAGVARPRRRRCGTRWRIRVAASAGACQHRLFLALHAGAAAAGVHHVEPAAVARHDPVQFGQRLDLVDDHLAHLRGALGGLLRHFQHATAKFVARGFQFVLHFAGHLLHARDHGGELVGGLLEHRVGFLRCPGDRAGSWCRRSGGALLRRPHAPPRTAG